MDIVTRANLHLLEGMDLQAGVAAEYDKNMAHHVGVSDVSGESLATRLSELMLQWRPFDQRLYFSLAGLDGYSHQPTNLSGRLYNHLKVKVDGLKDCMDGSAIELGIYLDANMDGYQDLVRKAAASQSKAGTVRFDASTGDVEFGGRVLKAPASPGSHALPVVPTLGKDGPSLKHTVDWKLKALVRIDVVAEDGQFQVTYHVRGASGILLQGEVADDDLSVVARKLMQFVFGNREHGKVLDMMDGVRQLLSGEKAGKVSAPVVEARRSRVMFDIGGWSIKLGILVIVFGIIKSFLDGGSFWFFEWKYLWGGVAVMVVGHLASLVLTPVFEARERIAAARLR